MMESHGEIARVVSEDLETNDADHTLAATTDHCSASILDGEGAFLTPLGGSDGLIEVSQRGEQPSNVDKAHLQSSMDGDSHANPGGALVSQKGLTVQSTDSAGEMDPHVRLYKLPIGPSGAAFEAFRNDYYVHPKRCKKERRMSSLSMGSAKASRSNRDRYVNIEEQYEMLKLHHLNLLNEIHETALMLNLFEQRQLIREQQAKMRQIENLPYHREVGQGNPMRSKISDDEHDVFEPSQGRDENGNLSKKRPHQETNTMTESNARKK